MVDLFVHRFDRFKCHVHDFQLIRSPGFVFFRFHVFMLLCLAAETICSFFSAPERFIKETLASAANDAARLNAQLTESDPTGLKAQ